MNLFLLEKKKEKNDTQCKNVSSVSVLYCIKLQNIHKKWQRAKRWTGIDKNQTNHKKLKFTSSISTNAHSSDSSDSSISIERPDSWDNYCVSNALTFFQGKKIQMRIFFFLIV